MGGGEPHFLHLRKREPLLAELRLYHHIRARHAEHLELLLRAIRIITVS